MWDGLINWFNPLWSNLLDFFSPVTSFFSSVTKFIGNIVGWISSIIDFASYGFNTALSFLWKLFSYLFDFSFFTDTFGVFAYLSQYFGPDIFYFVSMLFIIILLIVFSFLVRLIFGKLRFFKGD